MPGIANLILVGRVFKQFNISTPLKEKKRWQNINGVTNFLHERTGASWHPVRSIIT